MDKLYGLWVNLTQGRGAWAEDAVGNVICSVMPYILAAKLWNQSEGGSPKSEIREINTDGSPGPKFGEEKSAEEQEETIPVPLKLLLRLPGVHWQIDAPEFHYYDPPVPIGKRPTAGILTNPLGPIFRDRISETASQYYHQHKTESGPIMHWQIRDAFKAGAEWVIDQLHEPQKEAEKESEDSPDA